MLLVASLLAFGLLIPWLGFYWDDWPAIWFLNRLGPSGFVDVFTHDRPLLGYLFWVTTSLLGESTLGWQIFGFATHFVSSLLLWWLLRLVWPRRPGLAAWIALLFALYPGFTQQFISVTYSHVYIILSIFILSFILMILAIRESNGWLLLLSILCSAYSMFTVEYFFGLELFRPIILWSEFSRKGVEKPRLARRAILYWLPYAALMLVFLAWRLLVRDTPRGEVQIFDLLSADPVGETLALAKLILSNMFESSLLAWAQTVNPANLVDIGRPLTLVYILLVIASFAITFVFFINYAKAEAGAGGDPGGERRLGLSLVLLGIFGLFVAGWPFWATRLEIGLGFPSDRFTLPMMLGTSLLIAGLVLLLPPNRTLRSLVIGVLVCLAVGFHTLSANNYRRDWDTQKELFWQLTWRAPAIEPNTLILASELPFTHYSDNSLTAPLNWIYAPQLQVERMPYLLYQIEARLGVNLSSLGEGQPVYEDYRSLYFEGSTDQALVFYHQPPGCLQVLDPAIHAALPQKPRYISEAMPLSDVELVLRHASPPPAPPRHIFGEQPEPGWCYYYEKADLARQEDDWQAVVALGEQAFQLNPRLYPVNAPEYLPYIEAHARLGDWQRASELTVQAFELNSRMGRSLCDTWGRIQAASADSPQRDSTIAEMIQLLGCKIP